MVKLSHPRKDNVLSARAVHMCVCGFADRMLDDDEEEAPAEPAAAPAAAPTEATAGTSSMEQVD